MAFGFVRVFHVLLGLFLNLPNVHVFLVYVRSIFNPNYSSEKKFSSIKMK